MRSLEDEIERLLRARSLLTGNTERGLAASKRRTMVGHHGMMDPDEQLARMTTRYSLTTEQQDRVKPILVSQQHQIQG